MKMGIKEFIQLRIDGSISSQIQMGLTLGLVLVINNNISGAKVQKKTNE